MPRASLFCPSGLLVFVRSQTYVQSLATNCLQRDHLVCLPLPSRALLGPQLAPMLGAPCLAPASHWRAGSGVATLQHVGAASLAAGLSGEAGCLLLLAQSGPVSELEEVAPPVAASLDGALLLARELAGPRLRAVRLAPGQHLSSQSLELREGDNDAPVAAITRQEREDVFAVGKGR